LIGVSAYFERERNAEVYFIDKHYLEFHESLFFCGTKAQHSFLVHENNGP
jgi:hypothetical protein